MDFRERISVSVQAAAGNARGCFDDSIGRTPDCLQNGPSLAELLSKPKGPSRRLGEADSALEAERHKVTGEKSAPESQIAEIEGCSERKAAQSEQQEVRFGLERTRIVSGYHLWMD